MEDNFFFNVGCGCVFIEENMVEFDVFIMDGYSLVVGEIVMLKFMLFLFWEMYFGFVVCVVY